MVQVEFETKLLNGVWRETFRDTDARANAGDIEAASGLGGAPGEAVVGAAVDGVAVLDGATVVAGAVVAGAVVAAAEVVAAGGSKTMPNCVRCVVRSVTWVELAAVTPHPSDLQVRDATFQYKHLKLEAGAPLTDEELLSNGITILMLLLGDRF
jgi:hypothetical protein